MTNQKWPKKIPELNPEQLKIKDDFMKHWHQVLPLQYRLFEKFNQGFPIRYTRPSSRVMEIGAGLGEHIAYENLENVEYYALEIRSNMAKEIKNRFPQVKTIVGDCQEKINLEENYFDRVNAIHVFEHLPNLPKALEEIHRLIKPQGQLAVVIPCEGGLLYSLGRIISAKRIFEKRYQQNYDFFIKTEHINLPKEIIEEIKKDFIITKKSFFPFFLPVITLNLALGLICQPKK